MAPTENRGSAAVLTGDSLLTWCSRAVGDTEERGQVGSQRVWPEGQEEAPAVRLWSG